MPLVKETKVYKTFIVSISLTIALVLSGIFLGMAIRTRQLIYESSIAQARALFNSIVLARKWNAGYGGVFVEKKEGVESNPYLVNPDIITTDGKVYTKRNPALMTREISKLSHREGLFKYNITSLRPLNHDNTPDEFERESLKLFESGKNEVFRIFNGGSETYFRYMSPLYVEDGCLACHAKQGYSKGDIRGGISVTFNIGHIQDKLKTNTLIIVFSAVATTFSLLGLIYFYTIRLIGKVSEARKRIEEMAITDSLTEMYNRRYLMSRFEEEFEKAKRLNKELGCIVIDIDHFKALNDKYGHLIGDNVLKEVAVCIKESVRIYDIAGRYGGEEFIVITPDADFEGVRNLAERIRTKIKDSPIRDSNVTISLGITCVQESDGFVDDMIKRADDGLYKAKNTGRDRVEWV